MHTPMSLVQEALWICTLPTSEVREDQWDDSAQKHQPPSLRLLSGTHMVEGEIKIMKVVLCNTCLCAPPHPATQKTNKKKGLKLKKKKKFMSRMAISWLFSSRPSWQAWAQAIDTAYTRGRSDSKQVGMKYTHLAQFPSITLMVNPNHWPTLLQGKPHKVEEAHVASHPRQKKL